MSMNGTSESGFWSESLLMAWSGSVPDKIFLIGTSHFLPLSVRGTASITRTGLGRVLGKARSATPCAAAARYPPVDARCEDDEAQQRPLVDGPELGGVDDDRILYLSKPSTTA